MKMFMEWLVFAEYWQLILAIMVAIGVGWLWWRLVDQMFKRGDKDENFNESTRGVKVTWPSYREIRLRLEGSPHKPIEIGSLPVSED